MTTSEYFRLSLKELKALMRAVDESRAVEIERQGNAAGNEDHVALVLGRADDGKVYFKVLI